MFPAESVLQSRDSWFGAELPKLLQGRGCSAGAKGGGDCVGRSDYGGQASVARPRGRGRPTGQATPRR